MKELKPILLVEDDSIDSLIVWRALKECNIMNPLVCPDDSGKAISYLAAQNEKCPCIVFLDLNMPGIDGREFLKKVKADHKLKMIPVIVLTNSEDSKDIADCFALGAAGYIVKPDDYQQFKNTIGVVHSYWSLCRNPNAN